MKIKFILKAVLVIFFLFTISLTACSCGGDTESSDPADDSGDGFGFFDDSSSEEPENDSDYSTATCDGLYEYLSDAVSEMRVCSSDSDCTVLWLPTFGSCGCTHNLVVNENADTTDYEEIVEALENQEGCGLAGTCDCPDADGYICQGGLCNWNYL